MIAYLGDGRRNGERADAGAGKGVSADGFQSLRECHRAHLQVAKSRFADFGHTERITRIADCGRHRVVATHRLIHVEVFEFGFPGGRVYPEPHIALLHANGARRVAFRHHHIESLGGAVDALEPFHHIGRQIGVKR